MHVAHDSRTYGLLASFVSLYVVSVKDRNRAPKMAGSPTQPYTRTLRPRNPPPVGASVATGVTARGAGSRTPDEVGKQ